MQTSHADAVFLRNLTGLTKGNLSSHLMKLEQGGLVAAAALSLVMGTYLTLAPEPSNHGAAVMMVLSY